MLLNYGIALLCGAGLGFGFRGLIGREKIKLAEFVRHEAVRGSEAAGSVLQRFAIWKKLGGSSGPGGPGTGGPGTGGPNPGG